MRKRYFWSIFLVLYVGFVFGNSLTPAVESSAQSMSVLQLVTGAMKVVGLGNVGVTEHFIRKA
ncbi:MAG: VanZ family protein, partial [Hungatella hathewayi]|nr:VanZ family protein [Hungatella hathewayi]